MTKILAKSGGNAPLGEETNLTFAEDGNDAGDADWTVAYGDATSELAVVTYV
jgi:hypothetical protein